MTETSVKQFGNELTSFFVLVLLNLALGAMAMAFGVQFTVTTLMQFAARETPSVLLSAARILIGAAGIVVGFFWIQTSANILRGIINIRKEYRHRTTPVPDETITGWIIAVLTHYRENRTVIRRMAIIGTIGGIIFLALGVANIVEGIQALAAAGQGPGYLALIAAAINLTIWLVTIHFAKGFRRYSEVWDMRLDRAGKGEESLKRALENG
jgi:hypothetical protein